MGSVAARPEVCMLPGMKNFSWAALLAAVLLVLGSCKDNNAKEEVLDLFDAYLAAEEGKDGPAAVALMDEKYVEDFQHILHAARTAKREQIYRLQPSERLRIASLRNRLTREELKTVDPKTAISLIISRGGEDDSDRWIWLGEVTFKKPRASGKLIVEGIELKYKIEFVQVEGVWKLDPACFDRAFDDFVVRWASRFGMTEDRYILHRESESSGKKVSDAIWDPPA